MICPLWALWVLTDVAAAFRSPLLELLFDHLHHLISENIYLSAVEERCLGKLKALSCGFDTRNAIDESGVCEGRPIGQSEMRQMAQCLRELGFVQDRNATRGPGLSRTRKWRWPGTGDTGAAR